VPPIEGEECAQGRGAAGCAIILGRIRQPRGFDRTHAVHAQKCSERTEIVALDLSSAYLLLNFLLQKKNYIPFDIMRRHIAPLLKSVTHTNIHSRNIMTSS
jgi:hypothetical protein